MRIASLLVVCSLAIASTAQAGPASLKSLIDANQRGISESALRVIVETAGEKPKLDATAAVCLLHAGLSARFVGTPILCAW